MTSVDTKQSLLAEARVTYSREQQQQVALTGKKANSNPTEADLIANDPSLQSAIAKAETASSSSGGGAGGGGAHGSSGGTPASGGGIAAAKAPPSTTQPQPATNVDVKA